MTTAVATRLERVRRRVDQQRAEAIALAHNGRAVLADIEQLQAVADLHEKAAHVLTAIGEQRQDQAQRQIEGLVTQGLQTIFGDDLSFHLAPAVRAKTPVVDFVIRSQLDDGTTVDTDVMDARGGGLAAIVGFLLRLVKQLLSRHRDDVIIFLDETFAHVSAEYLPRLVGFLKELVAATGVQIVMVTHEDAFTDAADVVYHFRLDGGVTKTRRV